MNNCHNLNSVRPELILQIHIYIPVFSYFNSGRPRNRSSKFHIHTHDIFFLSNEILVTEFINLPSWMINKSSRSTRERQRNKMGWRFHGMDFLVYWPPFLMGSQQRGANDLFKSWESFFFPHIYIAHLGFYSLFCILCPHQFWN